MSEKNVIDWASLDEEKTKFMYEEAKALLQNINASIASVTNKCFIFLGTELSILTILVATLFSQLDANTRPHWVPLVVISCTYLILAIALLLIAIWPSALGRVNTRPMNYLVDNFSLVSMHEMRLKHLQNLDAEEIEKSNKLLTKRNYLLTANIALIIGSMILVALFYSSVR